jgi:transcriptional regulator with XRE-family HTH domain
LIQHGERYSGAYGHFQITRVVGRQDVVPAESEYFVETASRTLPILMGSEPRTFTKRRAFSSVMRLRRTASKRSCLPQPNRPELRRARKFTQARVAKKLGIGQDGVSKLEKRAALMISTLRKTIEAMGGSLSLVAEFPDRDPVVLSGISEDEPDRKPTGKKRARAWREKLHTPVTAPLRKWRYQ